MAMSLPSCVLRFCRHDALVGRRAAGPEVPIAGALEGGLHRSVRGWPTPGTDAMRTATPARVRTSPGDASDTRGPGHETTIVRVHTRARHRGGDARPRAATADAHGGGGHRARFRPVVFVHGFVGSGGQFESQAMRFASNGYPVDSVAVEEYDSLFSTITMAGVWDDLDHKIDALRAKYHVDKVDLVGHSLGTTVSQGYLTSSPARAARVAHYANLDGAPASAPPAGVPTVAVWVRATSPPRSSGPPTSICRTTATCRSPPRPRRSRPCTSCSTDGRRGRRRSSRNGASRSPDGCSCSPRTPAHRRDAPGLEGRSPYRVPRRPPSAGDAPGGGRWLVGSGARRQPHDLRLAVTRATSTHHFYFQPFLRSDHQVHLLTQDPAPGSMPCGRRATPRRPSRSSATRSCGVTKVRATTCSRSTAPTC